VEALDVRKSFLGNFHGTSTGKSSFSSAIVISLIASMTDKDLEPKNSKNFGKFSMSRGKWSFFGRINKSLVGFSLQKQSS
jgi:hypothetical protein